MNKYLYIGLPLITLAVIALVVMRTEPINQNSEITTDDLSNNTQVVETGSGYEIDDSDFLKLDNLISAELPKNTLSDDELAGLMLMREEEKLAHDVYLALYDIWGLNTFSNIASSEKTHMDTMAELLLRYQVEDPVKSNARGVFADEALQGLYNDLVAKGSVSLNEALRVGALIEDLDIYDLETLISQTDKTDIITVYENLQKGSRNHLRAFVGQLGRRGDSYSPSYISAEEYDSIISSSQERGRARG